MNSKKKLNLYKIILFIPLLITSMIMTMSTNSFFYIWMLMELNMMMFMPILIFDKETKKFIPMFYILIQSLMSFIMLFSYFIMNTSNTNPMLISMIIMFLSLLTKMGLPPIYMWYPKMMKNASWLTIFLLTSLQKFIPMYLLSLAYSNMSNFSFVMKFWIYASLIMITFMAMNYFNLKLMLSYSSMLHTTIMVMMIMYDFTIMLIYFMVYTSMMQMIMLIFNYLNISMIGDLKLIMNYKTFSYYKLIVSSTLMSLSGLPPLFGFMLKWYLLEFMSYQTNLYMMTTLILMSLIFIYIYGQMILIMFSDSKMKIKFLYPNMKINMNYMKLINLMMPITMIVVYQIFI